MSGIRSFFSGLIVGGLFCAAISLVIASFNPPSGIVQAAAPVVGESEGQVALSGEVANDNEQMTSELEQPLQDADIPAASVPDVPGVGENAQADAGQVNVQEATAPLSSVPLVDTPVLAQDIEPKVDASDAPRQPLAATQTVPNVQTTNPAPVVTARTPASAAAPSGREADAKPQKPGADLDARQIDDQAPGINQPIVETAPKPQVAVASNPVSNAQTKTPNQPATTSSVTSRADETGPDAPAENQVNAGAAPKSIERESQETPVTAETQEALPPAPVQSGPAFEAFAADVALDSSRPYLAVVLMDAGSEGVAQDELLEIDVPVTFAVDPSADNARRAEAAYRDGGFEVVAIVPDRGDLALNQRTQLDRVGPILETYFENVPGAVALIDRPLGDFYRNIRVVNIITQNLNRTGHGMLIHERFGINAAIGSAAAKRVPVAAVKRVIDTNRSEAAIRASLDRAVLEASKTGSAIVFGRTYPETVSTLITWLVSNTARSVSIAPLTATVNR